MSDLLDLGEAKEEVPPAAKKDDDLLMGYAAAPAPAASPAAPAASAPAAAAVTGGTLRRQRRRRPRRKTKSQALRRRPSRLTASTPWRVQRPQRLRIPTTIWKPWRRRRRERTTSSPSALWTSSTQWRTSGPTPSPRRPQVPASLPQLRPQVPASPPQLRPQASQVDFNPNPGQGGDLLGLGGAEAWNSGVRRSEPETEKKMIFVYHKGEKNCACGPEDGRIFEFEQFDQLQNGQTYIIEAAGEREDLKKITGDRFRRLKVQIDPLLHVEAVKAIDRMRRGSNLLKHTHYGFPHLRQFQLSDDKRRLIWYSGVKRKEDSLVNLDEVVEIKLGQQTPVFLHYRLPMLEHLSFSIIYGPKGAKTLDLTCKDEFEFDHWVTGLKAIFYQMQNKQISKEALLAHSKRFQKAMEKNNVGIKLTKLPEVKEKGHVGLDDCIEIVTHTPQQLDTKMERLRERLKSMSQQVSRLDHHSAAEMEVDLSLLTGQGPAYASVFVQDEDAQDEEMEIRRMHELVEQTTQVLQQARNELIALNQRQRSDSAGSTEAKAKKKETAACKHIDQLLWKAEVDLENVEDMYVRHMDNQKDTYSLADFNQRVSRTFSEIEESLNSQLDSIKSFFTR
ncbi:unnamed protein product [Effrenium voratum]|nr:unnamed protein product [Effrenium voratum]